MTQNGAGQVLICTGANATGQCSYRVYEMDKCQQLAAPFHRNAATFAPDGDAFACYPRVTNCGDVCMSPTGCTFGAVNFSYPHKYDLRAIRWDKLLSSFSCFATKPS
ncbi:hypothetical protein CDD83_5796 [Cordyceps sp. RAO-2017]|nr:hypothetical protein CDD83_5796 [Cordyceps sp. RAO-2017]